MKSRVNTRKIGRYYTGNPASKAFVGPPDPFKSYSCTWHWSDVRRHALRVVSRALYHGRIPAANTQQCSDCDRPAQAWDHRDYSQPLKVDPVCTSCNVKRGPGLHAFLPELTVKVPA